MQEAPFKSFHTRYGRLNPATMVGYLRRMTYESKYTPVDDYLVALDGYRVPLGKFDLVATNLFANLMYLAWDFFQGQPLHPLRQEFIEEAWKAWMITRSAMPAYNSTTKELTIITKVSAAALKLMPEKFPAME